MIEADPIFGSIPNAAVFIEDALNPETAILKASTFRMRVMVAAAAHVRKSGVGPKTSGDWTLVVTVFENATRRKEDDGTPTLSDVAEAIVEDLHWQTVGNAKIIYQEMHREDFSASDYRMTITFLAHAALDGSAVVWGTGDTLLSGHVTKALFARGGVNVFEPSRSGDAKYLGTRDRHWRIRLVANSAITDKDDLPDFGETFTYDGESYVTESAELSLEGEGPATVTLTGRTIPAATSSQNQ